MLRAHEVFRLEKKKEWFLSAARIRKEIPCISCGVVLAEALVHI